MSGFRKFILRGNVVDLAIGVVIGVAFGAVITAVVTGVLNPIIGLAGTQNFDLYSWCLRGTCTAQAPGHLLRYGTVLTALLTFLLTAAAVYLFVVKPVGRLMDRSKTEPDVAMATKECPECLSKIPTPAARCAFCTVEQLDVELA